MDIGILKRFRDYSRLLSEIDAERDALMQKTDARVLQDEFHSVVFKDGSPLYHEMRWVSSLVPLEIIFTMSLMEASVKDHRSIDKIRGENLSIQSLECIESDGSDDVVAIRKMARVLSNDNHIESYGHFYGVQNKYDVSQGLYQTVGLLFMMRNFEEKFSPLRLKIVSVLTGNGEELLQYYKALNSLTDYQNTDFEL